MYWIPSFEGMTGTSSLTDPLIPCHKRWMEYRKKQIACFGGGTGLPALLSGLKRHPWLDITAIVNMFDSGGSSGELKDRFGILPPGDILKCLLALSEDEQVARKILLKRIRNTESPGHTGGNVLLLALEKVYGSHLHALDALGQILSIQGKVVPVTLEHASLAARYEDGGVYSGETSVDIGVWEGKEVAELFLQPSVQASDQAVQAIRDADALCVGPGSFYTSVLPNFLPSGIREAIAQSSAPLIYICNLLTEGSGMRGYTLPKITNIVERVIGRKIDVVVANSRLPQTEVLERYAQERKHPIVPDGEDEPRALTGEIWFDETIARHDPHRLAGLVCAAINRVSP